MGMYMYIHVHTLSLDMRYMYLSGYIDMQRTYTPSYGVRHHNGYTHRYEVLSQHSQYS